MTKAEILARYPNASVAFIRCNADPETVGGLPSPIPQRRVQKQSLVASEGKEESPVRPRLRVVITSRRSRLTDTDNVCAKWLIDALRYKRLIPDDSPDHIILEVRQQKVDSKAKEGTLVEITPCLQ